MSRRKTRDEFIENSMSIHGDIYDYSEVVYVNNKTKVRIKCPFHNFKFDQTPNNHLNGDRCPICAKSPRWTTETIIREFVRKFGDRYDYSGVEYVNSQTKISIICPKHSTFLQTPAMHMSGRGCPKCKMSLGERLVMKFLLDHGIYFKYEYSFSNCIDKLPLPFDFFIPSKNLLIEYDGIQHFKPVDHFGGQVAYLRRIKNDIIKNEYSKNKGFELIRIPYWDIDNIDNILESVK